MRGLSGSFNLPSAVRSGTAYPDPSRGMNAFGRRSETRPPLRMTFKGMQGVVEVQASKRVIRFEAASISCPARLDYVFKQAIDRNRQTFRRSFLTDVTKGSNLASLIDGSRAHERSPSRLLLTVDCRDHPLHQRSSHNAIAISKSAETTAQRSSLTTTVDDSRIAA